MANYFNYSTTAYIFAIRIVVWYLLLFISLIYLFSLVNARYVYIKYIV